MLLGEEGLLKLSVETRETEPLGHFAAGCAFRGQCWKAVGQHVITPSELRFTGAQR